MRVLVVDDESEVRRIRDALAPRGIEVAGSNCADDAFRFWQSGAGWNLVVTALWITPGEKIRDGMELVKAIRATSGSQRIVIHTSDEGLLAPHVPVLRRPHSIEQLLRMLRLPVLPPGQPFEEETAVSEADPPCSSSSSPSDVRTRRRKGSIEY